jgi:hypothetical protein
MKIYAHGTYWPTNYYECEPGCGERTIRCAANHELHPVPVIPTDWVREMLNGIAYPDPMTTRRDMQAAARAILMFLTDDVDAPNT